MAFLQCDIFQILVTAENCLCPIFRFPQPIDCSFTIHIGIELSGTIYYLTPKAPAGRWIRKAS